MFIGGVSAGAALALLVASDFAADHATSTIIKGVVALCPFTVHPDNIPDQYKHLHKSYEENKVDVPFIDKEVMENFFHHAGALPDDKRTFVALATETHKRFPPTALFSCEYDPLRDDAYVMEHALKAESVPTQHDHYKGLPHCFWVLPMLPESSKLEMNVVDRIRWLIESMKAAH